MKHELAWNDEILSLRTVKNEPLTVTISKGEQVREVCLERNGSPEAGRVARTGDDAGAYVGYAVTPVVNGFWVSLAGYTFFFEKVKRGGAQPGVDDASSFTAPMPGRITAVKVTAGQEVSVGDVLVIMEAMKMEHRIEAPCAGTVTRLRCEEGDLVEQKFRLLDFEPASED